mmetsp:Transcript_30350/g.87111  ORF Transcript_30350/g.87111 Transcript_30350/m.87111 type:complete len:264 (+) Transcript_30350:23-814(+)
MVMMTVPLVYSSTRQAGIYLQGNQVRGPPHGTWLGRRLHGREELVLRLGASLARALRARSFSRPLASLSRIAPSSSEICALSPACSRSRESSSRCTRSRSSLAALSLAWQSSSWRRALRDMAEMRSRAAWQMRSSLARAAASCCSALSRRRAACAAAILSAICARSSLRQASAKFLRSAGSASAFVLPSQSLGPNSPPGIVPTTCSAGASGGGVDDAPSSLRARPRTSSSSRAFLLLNRCTRLSCTSRLCFSLSTKSAGRLLR